MLASMHPVFSRYRSGDVCGPGCWPIKGGGCDCSMMFRGADAPLMSPLAATTLKVLGAAALGLWLYEKATHRNRRKGRR